MNWQYFKSVVDDISWEFYNTLYVVIKRLTVLTDYSYYDNSIYRFTKFLSAFYFLNNILSCVSTVPSCGAFANSFTFIFVLYI